MVLLLKLYLPIRRNFKNKLQENCVRYHFLRKKNQKIRITSNFFEEMLKKISYLMNIPERIQKKKEIYEKSRNKCFFLFIQKFKFDYNFH